MYSAYRHPYHHLTRVTIVFNNFVPLTYDTLLAVLTIATTITIITRRLQFFNRVWFGETVTTVNIELMLSGTDGIQ